MVLNPLLKDEPICSLYMCPLILIMSIGDMMAPSSININGSTRRSAK
jgi:hypothetical protein